MRGGRVDRVIGRVDLEPVPLQDATSDRGEPGAGGMRAAGWAVRRTLTIPRAGSTHRSGTRPSRLGRQRGGLERLDRRVRRAATKTPREAVERPSGMR